MDNNLYLIVALDDDQELHARGDKAMSNDVLIPAIEKLTKELEELLRQVTKKKELINALHESMGQDPPYGDVAADAGQGTGTIRPDQYYGRPFATVSKEYLELRKRSCGAEEITRGLEQGGYDFRNWKEHDRVRLVAVNLAKNTVVFHKLPNNTFGLLAWYPEVAKPKLIKRIAKNEPEPVGDDTPPANEEGGTDPAEHTDLK